jgi:preprotein translocase subunit SecD
MPLLPRFSLAWAAVLLLACSSPARRAEYRSLEVRLVSEVGGQLLPSWSGSEALPVDSIVLFSGADFESIETSFAGGDDKKTPALWLRFNDKARRRFEDATTRFAGRRFAFIVGGKVVTSPKILHPISTGLFEITGPSDTDIQSMYQVIAP